MTKTFNVFKIDVYLENLFNEQWYPLLNKYPLYPVRADNNKG